MCHLGRDVPAHMLVTAAINNKQVSWCILIAVCSNDKKLILHHVFSHFNPQEKMCSLALPMRRKRKNKGRYGTHCGQFRHLEIFKTV